VEARVEALVENLAMAWMQQTTWPMHRSAGVLAETLACALDLADLGLSRSRCVPFSGTTERPIAT